MVTLKTIKAFFDDYKFDNNVLILNQFTNITNLQKYVKTNIRLLEINKGKKAYLPYFNRLKETYLKIKQNEDSR